MTTSPEPQASPAGNDTTGDNARSVPAQADIAHRAYMIWMECGCPHGQSQHHWLQAEQELAQLSPQRDEGSDE